MKIRFYFDEMMRHAIAEGLAKRGIVTVLANDIGMTEKEDDEHLLEATKRQMVLVTHDRGFAGRTAKRTDHAGSICWMRDDQPIGIIVRLLAEFAEQHTLEDAAGRVFWLK
jgi:predicted nuclease of predicted toxin-antitoxin system